MRRVGKSTILNIIKDEILKDVKDENKIFINFESMKFININDEKSLSEYLKIKLKEINGKVYFFFDEIQLVKNWERVINGIRVDVDSDIYITGSNSTLISGDLAALLSGRYVEFEIKPFVFSEFYEIFKEKNLNREELFEKFVKIGGMPFLKYFDL